MPRAYRAGYAGDGINVLSNGFEFYLSAAAAAQIGAQPSEFQLYAVDENGGDAVFDETRFYEFNCPG